MAGSRVSRRRGATSEDRRERLIYLGAGGILALVLLIVAVGVVLTVVLPPRAHVLTAGDREFNARQVADRAIYLVSAGNGAAQQNPSQEAMNSLVNQEILFQAGAPLVGEISEQEVRDAIAQRLGLNVPAAAPEATPEATPAAGEDEADESAEPAETVEVTQESTAAVDPAETPEATPEGYTDQQYADALASYLRVAPITRQQLEDIVRAGIIEDRLEQQFRDELPEAGDQLLLWALPTNDRASAQRLIDLVRGGAGFREAAVEAGIVSDPEAGVQELGWFAPTSINDRVSAFVVDLQAGEVSEIVDDVNRVGYEVYYVAERTADQPYEENVRDQLARRAFNDWRRAREDEMPIDRDLSSGEDRWIRDRVLDYLQGS